MYGICDKVIKMKQAKLTGDLQETYRKKIKTAIDIEKRKNDLFQYIDTKGMENFVVLLAGFFLEKTKDYPECFGLSITKKHITEDKEYKPQFIKIRKEEDVINLTTDKIPTAGMTAFLLFGYYDAVNNNDMSLFELKLESLLLTLKKTYNREYIIGFTKKIWKMFFDYIYSHNSIGASEAKSIFEKKLKEHNIWR